MKKSCKYCGGIHESIYICEKKVRRIKGSSQIERFRSSKDWKDKRNHIKDRDKHMCQICLRELYDTIYKYNYNDLSVHHITSMIEDYDKRLNDDNLITTCDFHHALAESGEIPVKVLKAIVEEQNIPPEG